VPPLITSIVEPSIVGQHVRHLSVETSCVTRRRFISVPALRDRIVCISQTREVEVVAGSRLVAVGVERTVEVVSLGSRSVTIGTLSPRVVVIPPEETCCE
jgi:hypothetical protein